MKSKKLNFLLACFFLSMIVGCSDYTDKIIRKSFSPAGEFKASLGGNYELVSANLQDTVIRKTTGEGIILGPHIVGINFNKTHIIGKIVISNFTDPDLGIKPGYFLIDIQSGKIKDGLNINEINKMKNFKLFTPDKLHKPSSNVIGNLGITNN